MMKWGKGRAEVPQHSYMASAYGVAMPKDSYQEAIKFKGEEGEASELWESMMPAVFFLFYVELEISL